MVPWSPVPVVSRPVVWWTFANGEHCCYAAHARAARRGELSVIGCRLSVIGRKPKGIAVIYLIPELRDSITSSGEQKERHPDRRSGVRVTRELSRFRLNRKCINTPRHFAAQPPSSHGYRARKIFDDVPAGTRKGEVGCGETSCQFWRSLDSSSVPLKNTSGLPSEVCVIAIPGAQEP